MTDYLCTEEHAVLRENDKAIPNKMENSEGRLPLLNYQHSSPSHQHKEQGPLGNMELLSDTTKIHALLCILPDNSYSSACLLLQTYNSLQACFGSKAQKFRSPLSLSVPHIHTVPLFCMTERPKFIINRLLLSEISSFLYLLN